jgi:hypothetical protein
LSLPKIRRSIITAMRESKTIHNERESL